MHECPNCGQACDCDGEDVWHDWPFNLDCTHDCEDDEDDDQDDFDLECCVDCGSPEIAGTCGGCGALICARHATADPARLCMTCRKRL